MSKYAIINGALVENVIIADKAPVIAGRTVVDVSAIPVGPGDTYDGSAFTPRVPSARELAKNSAGPNVRQAYAVLRTWANQAHTASAAYPGQSAAQQAATLAVVLDRLGTFFDRFADLLVSMDLDS